MSNRFSRCAIATLTLMAACSVSLADISGLTLGSYAYNQKDAGSPAIVSDDAIQLTTGGGQNRSIWFKTKQNIKSFTTSFTYHQDYLDSFAAFNGFAFVVSNNPAGTAALGNYNDSSGCAGLVSTAAVAFHTTQGSSSMGFYYNGVITNSDTGTGAVQFANRGDVRITITYDGTVLSVFMADGSKTFGPHGYLIGSMSGTALGSDVAYIGFTAQTSNGNPGNHHLSDFTFTTIPSAPTAAAFGMAGLMAVRRRR